MRGALHVGVVPVLNVALMPDLLGLFAAKHPGISLTVEEISSTEIETALEEGRMDVGLGFLTRHSPNLRYERLCTDEFALIVSEAHPWCEAARHSVFRAAPAAPAAIVRHLRHAPNDGPNLPEPSGPSAHGGGAQRDRDAPSLARAPGSGRHHAEDRVARKRSVEVESDSVFRARKLDLDIGLLRLSDSGANSAVGAFTTLAKAEVPKLIRS